MALDTHLGISSFLHHGYRLQNETRITRQPTQCLRQQEWFGRKRKSIGFQQVTSNPANQNTQRHHNSPNCRNSKLKFTAINYGGNRLCSIELLATLTQSSDCLPFPWKFSATREKPFPDQAIELQSLSSPGCWCWTIYQQYPMCRIPRITLAFKGCSWFLMGGQFRYFEMYGDSFHHGAVQYNISDDALSEKDHHGEWRNHFSIKWCIFIIQSVTTQCISPWLDILHHHRVLHVWLKYLLASADTTGPGIIACDVEVDPGIIWERYIHSH